jgi:UDP:flavonoid glycosyltransferase YjiC (YdhE family)
MATILFSPLPEEGHLNPSFKVARGLRERGHQILYLAFEDLRDRILSEGFEHVPLFPDLYPAGLLARQRSRLSQARSLRQILAELRDSAAHTRAYLSRWEDGSADRLLASIDPDLVVADSMSPFMALTAYGAKRPAALFNVVLPSEQAIGVPPCDSLRIPVPGLADRLRITLCWKRYLLRKSLRKQALRWLGCDEDLPGALLRIARRAGLAAERIDFRTSMGPALRLPEIVLCPRELDFPHPEVADRHYVEAAIDLERRDGGELPWHRLDPDRPLIYCAMGSQAHRSGEAGVVVQAAIEAVRGRESWQLVVAVGASAGSAPADEIPNVIRMEHVPQLEILRRAALMITHGGLGSIKECVYFGVPMIVFPLMRDQPGNAARVVHHGLGALGTSVPAALRTEIERTLGDGTLRTRTRIFSQRFQALERERPSLGLLESLLRPSAAADRSRRTADKRFLVGEPEISSAFARS